MLDEIKLLYLLDLFGVGVFAVSGASVYLILQFFGLPPVVTIILSMGLVISLRLAAIQWDWHLSRFRIEE